MEYLNFAFRILLGILLSLAIRFLIWRRQISILSSVALCLVVYAYMVTINILGLNMGPVSGPIMISSFFIFHWDAGPWDRDAKGEKQKSANTIGLFERILRIIIGIADFLLIVWVIYIIIYDYNPLDPDIGELLGGIATSIFILLNGLLVFRVPHTRTNGGIIGILLKRSKIEQEIKLLESQQRLEELRKATHGPH